MNYHSIFHDDMKNGTGLRVVLFVSGCSHNCRGCQNPDTHDFKSGELFDKSAMDRIRKYLNHDYIDGITLTGGDPLHPANLTDIDELIHMMVGRVIYENPKTKSAVAADAPVVLKVEHLNAGKMVQDVSFELRKGEILGFSGLMGAGRTETARALFGADPKTSGDIYINGKKVFIHTPEDAVKCGIGYLSEDRKRFGIVVQKTVAENTTMAAMKNFMKGLFIDKKKEEKVAQEYVEALATKTPGVDQLVVNLSGGNQQKVVIAKWLTRDCEILIFDEPTRGIDVGAKNEIYKLMNQLAAQGKSIIMISSEMTEILRMSDRIIVMCEGKKTGELDISEATQENIMNLATREIS